MTDQSLLVSQPASNPFPALTLSGYMVNTGLGQADVGGGAGQYVVFAHWMLCCPVGYVERGLTSRDRLNSSDNYLLLGFLLAMPSQTVLLLVR